MQMPRTSSIDRSRSTSVARVVAVLLGGERAGPHLGGVGAHGLDHATVQVVVFLQELRIERLVQTQEVVEDQDLTGAADPGADADGGDLQAAVTRSATGDGMPSRTRE